MKTRTTRARSGSLAVDDSQGYLLPARGPRLPGLGLVEAQLLSEKEELRRPVMITAREDMGAVAEEREHDVEKQVGMGRRCCGLKPPTGTSVPQRRLSGSFAAMKPNANLGTPCGITACDRLLLTGLFGCAKTTP